MTHIHVKDGRTGYKTVVDHVVLNGRERSPRGLKTLDAGITTVTLESSYDVLPTKCGRDVSPTIAALEAVQLIGGFSVPELMPPQFDRFKTVGGTFHGAYGPRVSDQLSHAVAKLRDDPDTRQAVVTIWDAALDNPPYRGHVTTPADVPCTVGFGLQIVNGDLEMHTIMRSNDVWLGTPYDWFQFTQLQRSVANVLGVPAGSYHHTAWSLHIYEEHVEAARSLRTPPDEDWTRGTLPNGLGCWGEDLERVRLVARELVKPKSSLVIQRLTESEQWYRDMLRTAMFDRGLIDDND